MNALRISLALFAIGNSSAWADRYETVTSQKSATIGEGETALVIFAATGSEAYNLVAQYTPNGGDVVPIPLKNTGSANAGTSASPSSENPLPLVGPATLALLEGTKNVIGIRIVSTTHTPVITPVPDGTP